MASSSSLSLLLVNGLAAPNAASHAAIATSKASESPARAIATSGEPQGGDRHASCSMGSGASISLSLLLRSRHAIAAGQYFPARLFSKSTPGLKLSKSRFAAPGPLATAAKQSPRPAVRVGDALVVSRLSKHV
jgi:hypothetical protein